MIRLVIIGLFAWQGLGAGKGLAQTYQDPDYEFEVFNEDALSLRGKDREVVVEALAALVSNFPNNGLVDMDLREKALAIALRLDALSAPARSARQALLNGEVPQQTGYFNKLPAISKVLWDQAMVMKKRQDPGDANLLPLIMEIALVIHPAVAPNAAIIYTQTVDALGKQRPEWKDFVHLDGGKKTSTAKAGNILAQGHKAQTKMVADAAAKEAKKIANEKKAAVLAEQAKMAAAATTAEKTQDVKAGLVGKMTPREVNVVFLQSQARVGVEHRLGKVILDVRDAVDADAVLFNKSPGDSLAGLGMRLKYVKSPVVPGWITLVYKIMRPRMDLEWPRGKVGEVDFTRREESDPVAANQRILGGVGTGVLLATEGVIKDVTIDPKALVFARTLSDQSVVMPKGGDLIKVVSSAKQGDFDLLVVPRAAEGGLMDWAALGNLERLIHPQIIAAANFDDLAMAVRMDRETNLEEALELFSEIEDLTAKMTLLEAAKNEVVQQRLEAIVEQFPRHLSAKALLAYGREGDEMRASLSGSIKAVNDALMPLKGRYSTAMNGGGENSDEVNEFGLDAGDQLRKIRGRVNEDVRDLVDLGDDVVAALVDFLQLKNKTSSSGMQKRESVEEALVAYNAEMKLLRAQLVKEKAQSGEAK